MTGSRRRALVATALGVAGATVGIAGVGLAYLREWRRAAAWFATVLGAGIALVTWFTDPATVTVSELPLEVVLPVLGLLGLSVADTYRLAAGSPRRGDPDAPSCPACGGTVDPGIDFCPWCATRLEFREPGTPPGVESEDRSSTSR